MRPCLKTALLAALVILTINNGLLTSAMAKGSGYIFVSSERDNAVVVLDPKSFKVIKTIATGDRPRHLRFNGERTLIYAACGEGESIDVIDVAKLEVTQRYEDIEDPEMFDLGPAGRYMYISLEDDGALGILDLSNGEFIGQIEVGDEPEGVLVTPDGKTPYVTSEVPNMVHEVDIAARRIAANIVVGNRPRRLALTPDGTQLWVSNELNGTVSVIDPKTRKIVTTIGFSPKGFRPEQITPVGITFTENGETAFIALGRANHVAVVSIKTRKVKKYILVGNRVWNGTLSRDNKRLFMVNGLSDDISIIDVDKLKIIRSVPVGRVPHTVLIDD